MRERQDALQEKELFLQTEQKNNAEVDLKITGMERVIGKKREALVHENKRLLELADQVDVVRSTLSKAATEMSQTRAQCTELVGQIEEKKVKLDRAKKKLAAAEKALERSRTHTGDLEKAAKQAEEVHQQEEARIRAAERELTSLKERMFHESEKLFAARQDESNIQAEISGADRSSRNASYRIAAHHTT